MIAAFVSLTNLARGANLRAIQSSLGLEDWRFSGAWGLELGAFGLVRDRLGGARRSRKERGTLVATPAPIGRDQSRKALCRVAVPR